MTGLIITNGDAAADMMRAAGFDAEILPWRDVLHEGPVPETTSLERLSAIRAGFLADAFGQTKEEIAADMERRDRMIRGHDGYDEITLWFEHDLYDQLQVMQILDFFHGEGDATSVHLVQADDYLGTRTPENIGRLEMLKTPVSTGQTALAASLFSAFRSPTPAELALYLDRDLGPLPHMQQALRRLFEELPSTVDGLSRTQRQALSLIEREDSTPMRLFGAVQALEEAVFMGDWSFWRCLEEMAFNLSPLVEGLPGRFGEVGSDEHRRRYLESSLSLTETGRAVLRGDTDHADINDIDRWLGGAHIAGDRIWRWNQNAKAVVAPA